MKKPRQHIVQRSIKWLMRLLYAVGFAVAYYLLFSIFFDTPIEHELKKSTGLLERKYAQLDNRFDTLQDVYDNLSERDRNIYKLLFESDPYVSISRESQRQRDLSQLSALSNYELSKRFDWSLSRLEQRVVAQNIRKETQLEYMIWASNQINAIPSIQPVDNKGLTLLTASYGRLIHPFYKTAHLHQGVDYSVPVGTAVFATGDGVVETIENKGQSTGLSVLIRHSSRYKTLYGNLDKLLVAPGRKVVRGDIIAFSGNSGLSFAPHLHYEVWLNGQPVNPLPFFFSELNIDQKAKMEQVASVGMQSFE